jgi:hypothetical protein
MLANPSTSDDPYYAEAVQTLDEHTWAVIDMDTGTVLGTNIVLVPFPQHDEAWCDTITSSDSDALAHAEQHGITLYRLRR